MVIVSPRFYYIRLRLVFRLLYLQLFRYFGFWRLLLTLMFLVLFTLHTFFLLLFRLIDEIFYPAYRKVTIKEPVFIVANPRSGTTYLHRLLCMDTGHFTYMKFAHTFYPTVSFVRLAMRVQKIDRFFGGFISKTLNALDKKLYGGWEDIHAMGFNKAEEDEAIFASMGMSPGLMILFPFSHLVKDTWSLDHAPDEVKTKVMDAYESSLKRFVYATGQHQVYLCKNVMSSGRLQCLMERFPDARLVYIARNPLEALPSFVSMFTAMYPIHSPGLPANSPAFKEWAELGSRFYDAYLRVLQNLPSGQLYSLKYDDLIANPEETIKKIYLHFGWNLSSSFLRKLQEERLRSVSYRSRHTYSLEKYGITSAELQARNAEIFNRFEFSA